MNNRYLSISHRTRRTPFTDRVEAAGVTAYTVYNHMLLPTAFGGFEEDYWHLCEHVQVWDVSCQRQVELDGPDSERLMQLMTPRDIRKAVIGQGMYAPLCGEHGNLLNDPIIINFSPGSWWVSISDSDIKLWAKGLVTGFGLDVKIREPDVWPLAVQGPKAEELVTRLFGDEVPEIRFFRSKMLDFRGKKMMVARSGYSKQGGFEIYLNDESLAEPLWDELFRLGEDLNVKAGGPNLIERVESSLLSYGNDMTDRHNPFECGLDAFMDIDADIDSISLPALREIAGKHEHQLVGMIFDQAMSLSEFKIVKDGRVVGEIRSHVWSPRYRKHLAMVMMKRDYLENRDTMAVDGETAKIVSLPFDLKAIQ